MGLAEYHDRHGDYEREEWRPLGERVGWVEEDNLYLLPEAAFAAAQKQGRDSGEALTVTERTLRKRLHERGLLLSVERSRSTLAVRRTLGGRRQGCYTSQPISSLRTTTNLTNLTKARRNRLRTRVTCRLCGQVVGRDPTTKLTKENRITKRETTASVRLVGSPTTMAGRAATGG